MLGGPLCETPSGDENAGGVTPNPEGGIKGGTIGGAPVTPGGGIPPENGGTAPAPGGAKPGGGCGKPGGSGLKYQVLS